MANLAIRGHITRGKEVIEILEMLGASNPEGYDGSGDWYYCIADNEIIRVYYWNNFTVFTLEEFIEKLLYKLNELVLCDDGLLGVITKMEWDCEKSDMKYHISFNTSVYNKWYNLKNIKCKLAEKGMAKLAIRGHKTRGKEVIEILEMLGGANKYKISDTKVDLLYAVRSHDKFIIGVYPTRTFTVFTLEEFLKKFPYKVGDRVRVPEYESEVCISKMYWDGNEVQYEVVTDEVEWYSAKELNEFNEPNKEETINEMLEPVRKIGSDEILYYVDKNNGDIKENKEKKINQMSLANCDLDEVEIVLGDKFELKIEDGKYYAVRKKSLYPKTYEECRKILGCKADNFFTNFDCNGCDVEISEYEDKVDDLLQNFRKLRYCYDAYLKIAGERMGLGKPWEPDWNNLSTSHEFIKINKGCFTYSSRVLVFPTAEMRDAFQENFWVLIEICKELL